MSERIEKYFENRFICDRVGVSFPWNHISDV